MKLSIENLSNLFVDYRETHWQSKRVLLARVGLRSERSPHRQSAGGGGQQASLLASEGKK
eukprot:4408995-Amphidinium_carterae.1